MADDKETVAQTTQEVFPKCQQAYANSQPILNEWTNHSAFYAIFPSYYYPFAQGWLRKWLAWFDGYVPGIHDGVSGILSTRLATTLCYRLAEQVYGGGLLFANSKKAKDAKKALEFISGKWNDEADLDEQVLKGFVLAGAGGTSYIKTNVDDKKRLWIDTWRADQCWADIDFKGNVSRAKFLVAKYTKTVPNNDKAKEQNFYLVEERFIATQKDAKEYCKRFAGEIEALKVAPTLEVGAPYVRYNVYRLVGVVNDFAGTGMDRALNWDEIPQEEREKMTEQYGVIKLNVPQRLPFLDLGVDMLKWTSFISNLPQLPYGESIIAKIQAYLFEYDFMNSSMNTDFYLGRGRVLVPKSLQNPQARGLNGVNNGFGNYNQGLDSFLFTKVDYASTEDKKPEAIQFDLRANDWTTSRNHLLESIATAVGISPSTLASYLNDSSARTAREISSEESATALYVENRRKLFIKPLNCLIKRILLFYNYSPCVEVKFSKSGQTNTTLLTENTISQYQAHLISRYQAVKTLNPDMNEEEIQVEIARIEQDTQAEAERNSNFFDGQFNDKSGDFGDEKQEPATEETGGIDENSEEPEPELASDSDRESTNANQVSDKKRNTWQGWLSKLFGIKKKNSEDN